MAEQITGMAPEDLEMSPASEKKKELERTVTDMSLEQTMNSIEIMEHTNLAVDPRHYHAFQRVSGAFLLGFFTLKCSICHCRLRSLFGTSENSSENSESLETSSYQEERYEIVKCVACGIYVHRSCLTSFLSNQKKTKRYLEPCAVNKALVEQSMKESDKRYLEADKIENETIHEVSRSRPNAKGQKVISCPPAAIFGKKDIDQDDNVYINADTESSNPTPLVIEDSMHSKLTIDETSINDPTKNMWTQNGPPSHWALYHPESLAGLQGNKNSTQIKEQDNENKNSMDMKEDYDENSNLSTKQRLEQTFSFFSKTLQDNLFAFSKNHAGNNSNLDAPLLKDFDSHMEDVEPDKSISSSKSIESCSSEIKQNSTSITTFTSPAKAAYQAYHKIKQTKSNIAAATVAGSVVGGVAGLFVAGPAGAYIGMRLGQTFGVLGCVTGGTLNASVLIVGAAAGYKKIHSYHEYRKENEKVRMLTIGEEGMKRKMMLVRPNVVVSEYWEDVCFSVRREWQEIQGNHHKSNALFHLVKSKISSEDLKNSRKSDEDILEAEDSEIGLKDKVFLLVNRSLNDKNSLPGYTYRTLIEEFCLRRDEEADDTDMSKEKEELTAPFDSMKTKKQDHDPQYSRNRRQDSHGVIKFVTATLLDLRPGLGVSPQITEISVTAVESVVFGEIYKDVLKEIQNETKEKDDALMRNIDRFFKRNKNHIERFQEMLSSNALHALHMLCEAHTPSDKLVYCVEFLEMISLQFSSCLDAPQSKSMGADALLKLVCQHIIAAKIPDINAETLFLEEFSRDEQLLKGKEGYALVTLQAALHFLNSDENFDCDIFFNSKNN